jgi:ribosomal protein L15
MDKALDLLSGITKYKNKMSNLSEWAKEKFKHIETIARTTLHETWATKILDEIIESLNSIKLEKEKEDKVNLLKKISEIHNLLSELKEQLWW